MGLQTIRNDKTVTGMRKTDGPPKDAPQSGPQQRRPRAKIKQRFPIDTALPSAISQEKHMREVMIGSHESFPVVSKKSETAFEIPVTGKNSKGSGRIQFKKGLKSSLPPTTLTPSPIPEPEVKTWEVQIPGSGCIIVGDTLIKPIKEKSSSETPIKVTGKASKQQQQQKKVMVHKPDGRKVTYSPRKTTESRRRSPGSPCRYSEVPRRHSDSRRPFPDTLRRYSVSPDRRSSTSPRRRRLSYARPFKRKPVLRDNVYVTSRSSAVPYRCPAPNQMSPRRVTGYADLYGKGTIEGLKPENLAHTAPTQKPLYLKQLNPTGDSARSKKTKTKPRVSLLPPKPEKPQPAQVKLPADEIRRASEERLKQMSLEDASRSSKASTPETSPRPAIGEGKRLPQDSIILALMKKPSKSLLRKSVARPYITQQTIVRNLEPVGDSTESMRSESAPEKYPITWPPSIPSGEECMPARYSEPPSRVFGQRVPTKAVPVRQTTARAPGDTEKVPDTVPSKQSSPRQDTARKQPPDTEPAEQETVISSTDIVQMPGSGSQETALPQRHDSSAASVRDKDNMTEWTMLSPSPSVAPPSTLTQQPSVAPISTVPEEKSTSPKPSPRQSPTPIPRQASIPLPEIIESSSKQHLETPLVHQDSPPIDILQAQKLVVSYPPEYNKYSDAAQEPSAPPKCCSAPMVIGDPDRDEKWEREKEKLAPALKRSESLPNPDKLGVVEPIPKTLKKRVSFFLPTFGKPGEIIAPKQEEVQEQQSSVPSVYSQETPWHFGAPLPRPSKSDNEFEESFRSIETINPHYMIRPTLQTPTLPHVQLMQGVDLHPVYYHPRHLRDMLRKYKSHAPELVIDLVPEPEVIVPEIEQCLHNPGGTVAWYDRKPVERKVEIVEPDLSPQPSLQCLSRPWLVPTNMKLARKRKFPLLMNNREHGTPHALSNFCIRTLEKFWGMRCAEKVQNVNNYLDSGSSLKNFNKPVKAGKSLKMTVESIEEVEPTSQIVSCNIIDVQQPIEDAPKTKERPVKKAASSQTHEKSITVVNEGLNLEEYFFSDHRSSFDIVNIPEKEVHEEHDPAITVLSETLPSTSDIFPKHHPGKLKSRHSFVHVEPIPEEVDVQTQASQEFNITMQNLPKEAEPKPRSNSDATCELKSSSSGGFGHKEEKPKPPPKEPEPIVDDAKSDSSDDRWPYPYILHTSGSGGFYSETAVPKSKSKQSTQDPKSSQSLPIPKTEDVQQDSDQHHTPESDATKLESILSVIPLPKSPTPEPKTPKPTPKTPCSTPLPKTPAANKSLSIAEKKDTALKRKHSRTMRMPFGEPRHIRKHPTQFYLAQGMHEGVRKLHIPLSIANMVSNSARFSANHCPKEPSGMIPRCGLCGVSVED